MKPIIHLLAPGIVLLMLGCNTAEKRGEKAYLSVSRLHAEYVTALEKTKKLALNQDLSAPERQQLEDLIKEVRINRKGDELVQASLNHCDKIATLANGMINGFRGNLEDRIRLDIQTKATVSSASVVKMFEERIAANQRQLDEANRMVVPMQEFLPEIQKTRSEILDIGSKH